MNPQPHIGACSWKFDAWRGLVYSDSLQDMLGEYGMLVTCFLLSLSSRKAQKEMTNAQ